MKKYEWLLLETDTEVFDNTHFNEIVKHIQIDTNLGDIVNIDNKKKLIKFINVLKTISLHTADDSHFISNKHKLAFCILKHKGSYLDEEVGITRRHYIDKNSAKEWRDKMQKIFHPDKNIGLTDQNYIEVSDKINKMYKRLIGKA